MPRASSRRAIRWRWRGGGCTRRWRSRCGCTPTTQAAIEVSAYVVVPFLPRQSVARAALAWAQRRRLPTAPLERPLQAHRRAVREHLAHVDALRSELEAEGMPTEPARRRAGGAAAVGALQPDQGRQGPPRPEPARCGGARRARRAQRPRRAPARPRSGCASRSRSRASTSAPRTSTWSSTTTSSRRSWSRTRRGARRWAGCTGRC